MQLFHSYWQPHDTARQPLWLLGMMGLLVLAGCGKETKPLGQVVGRVTFQDKPVAEAFVLFSNSELGVYLTVETDKQGQFEVRQSQKGPGLPPGEYQIAVLPPMENIPVGPAAKDYRPKKHPNIPKKFRSIETSQVAHQVTLEESRLEIKM